MKDPVIKTERFNFKRREFWLNKHPALRGVREFDFFHPRRHRAGGRPYRYICNPGDEDRLRQLGYLVRVETVSCCDGALKMTFMTTNARGKGNQ